MRERTRFGIVDAATHADAQLRDALCSAFADYAVPMRPSPAAFDLMMRQRGLDRTVSRIATMDGAIVAIWLVGRRGSASYLIASGTMPEHRGRGIARALASASLDALRAAGVETFRTEVIAGNAHARSLYERLGMRTTRTLACFKLGVAVFRDTLMPRAPGSDISIRAVPWSDIRDHASEFADWPPSWQNDDASLDALGDDVLGLLAGSRSSPLAVAAVVPGNGTLARIAVRSNARRRGIGTALVRAAMEWSVGEGIEVINAQANDAAFAGFMRGLRADGTVDQCELSMIL